MGPQSSSGSDNVTEKKVSAHLVIQMLHFVACHQYHLDSHERLPHTLATHAPNPAWVRLTAATIVATTSSPFARPMARCPQCVRPPALL